MDYKTLTEEQQQTERQNIMDEIARRNDLADIPKQAELAQIVNDATATTQNESPADDPQQING